MHREEIDLLFHHKLMAPLIHCKVWIKDICGTITSTNSSKLRKFPTTGWSQWSKATLDKQSITIWSLSWYLEEDGQWEEPGTMQEDLMKMEMQPILWKVNNWCLRQSRLLSIIGFWPIHLLSWEDQYHSFGIKKVEERLR